MKRAAVFVAGRDPQSELGGGHSAYVRAHALAALRAGFEPHVFCVGRSTGIDHTEYGIVHRRFSPFRPFRELMIPFHGGILASHVAQFVASQPPPRIVHSFGVWGHAGWRATQLLARRGIASVPILSSYMVHEIEVRSKVISFTPDYPLWERLRMRFEHAIVRSVQGYERRAYRQSRLVLCNYDCVRRMIQDRHGTGVACHKIRYAAETAFAPQPGQSTSVRSEDAPGPTAAAPLIVCVSRHDPRKGIDVLLHALARLRDAGVPFRACLIGYGRLLDIHRGLCRQLRLEDCVAIPGFVQSSYAYLASADVYCLPSRHEQSGALALLEALQAGVAIVASHCDGIPEDVHDGREALLVPPGDPVALAEALSRALTDPKLRAGLAQRARRTFETRFSADTFTRDLAAVYAEFGMTP